MKKLFLTWVLMAYVGLLAGCGSTISSTYAGVKIGDTAAKKLTAGLKDGKAATASVSTYSKDDSSRNHDAAKTAIQKYLSTCTTNEPAKEASQWKTIKANVSYMIKDTDVASLKAAIRDITRSYVLDSLPSKFGNSYEGDKEFKQEIKIEKQYLTDLGLK